jgi:hypothetical protein
MLRFILALPLVLSFTITSTSNLNGIVFETTYNPDSIEMLRKIALESDPGKQDLINQRGNNETPIPMQVTLFDKSTEVVSFAQNFRPARYLLFAIVFTVNIARL